MCTTCNNSRGFAAVQVIDHINAPVEAQQPAAASSDPSQHGALSFIYEMSPFDRTLKFLQLFAVVLSIIVSVRVLFFKK